MNGFEWMKQMDETNEWMNRKDKIPPPTDTKFVLNMNMIVPLIRFVVSNSLTKPNQHEMTFYDLKWHTWNPMEQLWIKLPNEVYLLAWKITA